MFVNGSVVFPDPHARRSSKQSSWYCIGGALLESVDTHNDDHPDQKVPTPEYNGLQLSRKIIRSARSWIASTQISKYVGNKSMQEISMLDPSALHESLLPIYQGLCKEFRFLEYCEGNWAAREAVRQALLNDKAGKTQKVSSSSSNRKGNDWLQKANQKHGSGIKSLRSNASTKRTKLSRAETLKRNKDAQVAHNKRKFIGLDKFTRLSTMKKSKKAVKPAVASRATEDSESDLGNTAECGDNYIEANASAEQESEIKNKGVSYGYGDEQSPEDDAECSPDNEDVIGSEGELSEQDQGLSLLDRNMESLNPSASHILSILKKQLGSASGAKLISSYDNSNDESCFNSEDERFAQRVFEDKRRKESNGKRKKTTTGVAHTHAANSKAKLVKGREGKKLNRSLRSNHKRSATT